MGWLATIVLNAMLGLGGYWGARYAFRQPPGLPRGIATGILAWTWVTLGLILLGSIGLLRIEALFAWSGLGLALTGWCRFSGRSATDEARKGIEPLDPPAIVAVGFLIWVLVTLLGPTLVVPVRIVSDGPIYHLYFAARWWKEQRLFLIASPFGENAATYFPAGGDLWFTWLMVGLGGDQLAKIGQAPFYVLAASASYGLARRLGAGASSSMIALAWFVTCLPMLIFSLEPNVDTIFVAGYLACAYFLVRFGLGDGDLGALALAGLSAGGAWGSKPTATAFIPALLALAAFLIWRRGDPAGRRIVRLVVLLGSTALHGGYWFLRNAWIGGGNPLYPLQVSAFGRVILPGWYESSAMKRSQFYIDFREFGTLADILVSVFDPRLAPFWLASILGAWAIGRKRQLSGWIWACSALTALNIATYWTLIPYRTQQRFMLQAAGLWVVPLACLLDRGRLIRWVAVAFLAIHLMTPQTWPTAGTRFDGFWKFSRLVPAVTASAIPVPITRVAIAELASPGRQAATARAQFVTTIVFGTLAMAAAGFWGWYSRRPGWRRLAAAAVVTSATLAANTWIFSFQATGIIGSFPVFPDYLRGWIELDGRTRPGTRIAYAGTNLPYILMGPGQKNDVRYVNINAHRDWLLHDYARAARAKGMGPWPSPRPGWDRLEQDYDAWLENLAAERIQILVVCRAKPEDGLFNIADPQRFPIERRWAESHPESFTPVYGVAENEPEFRIYRVHPAIGEKTLKNSTERPPSPH